MRPRLYVLDGSHPCRCVERAFALKRVAYTRVVLPPLWHRPFLRLRLGTSTVPALVLDGVVHRSSREILAWLDAVRPLPPLLPADPARRRAVEAAERWAHDELQERARRLSWVGLMRRPGGRRALAGRPLLRLTFAVSDLLERRLAGGLDALADADVAALEADLDRIDGWIADGTLGGEVPHVADLHVGSSLWLLRRLPDVNAEIARRPCGELTRRWFGEPTRTVGAIGFRRADSAR